MECGLFVCVIFGTIRPPEDPLPPASEPENVLRAQLLALQTALALLQQDYARVCEKNAGLRKDMDELKQ